MTQTNAEALEAIRSHHRVLYEQASACGTGLRLTASAGGATDAARAALVVYLADEVLPHAIAEEQTIYRAAAERPALAGMVAEMTAEHRTLADGVGRLAGATDPQVAVAIADELVALLGAHIARENEELLPAMIADDVNLARLLGQMHDLIDGAGKVPSAASDPDADRERTVLALLLEAAAKLVDVGYGDDACRLAAAAWAALYEPRPELAARVTGALQGLTQLAGAEDGSCTCGGDHAAPGDPELDVRELAPAQRHQTIFAAYAHRDPGQGFVLVNDHDPKPLRYQFAAEHAGEFTWDALESGPEVWRVRIGRPAGAGDQVSAKASDEPELDVRQLAHGRRHDTIFAAYAHLEQGEGFVLVNDHDPRPLRYQFEAQYPDQYSWEYLVAGPEVWRVRIGRVGDGAGARAVITDPELDVREILHGQRHDTIFMAFNRLIPGAGFVLVNDHDPRPLRYQFEAQYPDQYSWEYLVAGPEVWRVRIGRVERAAAEEATPAA